MSSANQDGETAAIWQGFHHAWEYNHRLNRLGSYVRSDAETGRTVVGHTAASGTGGDVAHVSEFVTPVQASGVGFQAGYAQTTVECPRAVPTSFRIRVQGLALDPELAGRSSHTVLINGFDLYAERHADKLIAFDLEVTQPVLDPEGDQLSFDILGQLCFDCRTAECQLWPLTIEMEDVRRRRRGAAEERAVGADAGRRGIQKRPAYEQGVAWLKRQIAALTDLETLKRGIVGRDGDRLRRRLFRLLGRQFYLRVQRWRILTPYVVRVHYLIIGGDGDAVRVTDLDPVQNTYRWDAENEIDGVELGIQRVQADGRDPSDYDVNTFAFKQLSLSTELDQDFESNNPIQWGKGMHLLEWHTAVTDIQRQGGSITARLDLFYKSWSEAMNELITLTTWGAVRSAGSATLQARLALLQFKDAAHAQQRALLGAIRWPGGGLNAQDDPRAVLERPLDEDPEAKSGA